MGRTFKSRDRVVAVLLAAAALVVPARSMELRVHSTESAIAAGPDVDDQIEYSNGNPGFPVATLYGNIDGNAPGQAVLQRYERLFRTEFGLYPPDLVRKTGLKQIVFCEHLSFAGQYRNSVPDFQHNSWYLDVSRGAYSRLYLRRVIHHELFHVIDWRDGLLYSDPGWSALNPVAFRYGTGGASDQGNSMASLWTSRYRGFLDQYGTTAVEEDKAEVFSCMMVDSLYAAKRATIDPVLAAKMARIKQQLIRFCPSMDYNFWDRVSRAQRN